MKQERRYEDLLSEIARELDLDCLSDLHFLSDVLSISEAVARIPLDKYSDPQWKEAACYIDSAHDPLNINHFSSAEAARNYLLNKKRNLFETV